MEVMKCYQGIRMLPFVAAPASWGRLTPLVVGVDSGPKVPWRS
jgi:hypothetical protein